jgi:hypothetical protein
MKGRREGQRIEMKPLRSRFRSKKSRLHSSNPVKIPNPLMRFKVLALSKVRTATMRIKFTISIAKSHLPLTHYQRAIPRSPHHLVVQRVKDTRILYQCIRTMRNRRKDISVNMTCRMLLDMILIHYQRNLEV